MIKPGYHVEAPSLIRHGTKLWLFTALGDYSTCGYHTGVLSSDGIGAKFSAYAHTLMQTGPNDSPCGPGGADIGSGGNWVVYHVWKDGIAGPGGTRRAWVASVAWGSQGPTFNN